MGRLSTVDDGEVFAAVASGLTSEGVVSLQGILSETGVSVGSLYHRYGSREGLLAQVWLDAVSAFQEQFLCALTSGKPDAGEQAALATPRFCRKERDRALVLICCRRSEFLNDKTPIETRERMEAINSPAKDAVKAFAKTKGVKLDAARMALIGFPLGAVKLYLPQRPVPRGADNYVLQAYRSVVNGAC